MATVSFSSLVPGANENVNTLNTILDALKTGINAVDAENLTSATAGYLGLSQSGSVRRGKSIVSTDQSTSSTSYTTLTTPDRVQNVVLPTDGLIAIGYQAQWYSSVVNAARAAIFIGSNQLKIATKSSTAAVQEATSPGTDGVAVPLTTDWFGLAADTDTATATTADVTTGQVIGQVVSGAPANGGICYVFAAAGTYTVSVQFKTSSGTVNARGRKLWVWTLGF